MKLYSTIVPQAQGYTLIGPPENAQEVIGAPLKDHYRGWIDFPSLLLENFTDRRIVKFFKSDWGVVPYTFDVPHTHNKHIEGGSKFLCQEETFLKIKNIFGVEMPDLNAAGSEEVNVNVTLTFVVPNCSDASKVLITHRGKAFADACTSIHTAIMQLVKGCTADEIENKLVDMDQLVEGRILKDDFRTPLYDKYGLYLADADVTNADVTDLMYRVQRSRNSAMEAARKGAVLMYTSANFPNNTPDELARMLDEHMTLARKRIYDVDVKDLNIRGSKGGRSPIVVS